MSPINIKNKKDTDLLRLETTAIGAAFVRSFLDVPFAKEISQLIEAEKINEKVMPGGFETIRSFIPIIEFSYKAINSAVNEKGTNQILEIAAGFSPRGLEFTKNPNITYVECDLPLVISKKKLIYKKILSKTNYGLDNLHLLGMDILKENPLLKLVKIFKKEPITIISEGLLVYLNHNQKNILARNIYKILSYYGGLWITSDFPSKERIIFEARLDKNVYARAKNISQAVNNDIQENYFKNEKELVAFFSVNSLDCRFFKANILKEIKSISLFGLNQKKILSILDKRKILILVPIL